MSKEQCPCCERNPCCCWVNQPPTSNPPCPECVRLRDILARIAQWDRLNPPMDGDYAWLKRLVTGDVAAPVASNELLLECLRALDCWIATAFPEEVGTVHTAKAIDYIRTKGGTVAYIADLRKAISDRITDVATAVQCRFHDRRRWWCPDCTATGDVASVAPNPHKQRPCPVCSKEPPEPDPIF